MLFSVKYINTNIEDFQIVLDYFFRQLETNMHNEFSDNLFPDNLRLKLYKYGNQENGYKKFVNSFEEIFKIYNNTSLVTKQKIIDTYFSSNDIDEICNDINNYPIHYSEMDNEIKEIARYFISFYDSDFKNFVDKQKHIEAFQIENGNICPICGLYTSYQYDHFIPKGTELPIYPFSSVNPKNLIRICQQCNGSKSSNLIIYQNNDRKTRLLSFSPYSNFSIWEKLDFKLNEISSPGVFNSGEWKVTFTIKDGLTVDEISKINRWKDFYKIEDRFSKEIELGLKNWIQNFKIKNKTLNEMIKDTEPNDYNIKLVNGILVQNLFFKYMENINANLFLNKSISVNPLDLIREQENKI